MTPPDELEHIRREPGGDAYYADVLRHNGTEYGGAGKPRVPVPAEVYEAARAWDRRRREAS